MKKNELVIFEELKLKTPQSQWSSEHPVSSTPKEKDLKSIKLFEYFSKKFNKKTLWKIAKSGRLLQVNEYGEVVFSSDEECINYTPEKSSLKKYNSKILIYQDPHINELVSYWVKNTEGKIIRVNIKEKSERLNFWIQSWIRDEAIKEVRLEIENMKKKAYEYKKEDLENLIFEKEKKIKKKYTWRVLKGIVLTSMGLNFLNF